MANFFNFILLQKDKIIELLIQHMSLTVTSILIAIIVGVPLGIIISRISSLRKFVLGFVNLVQAVPSMALLGLLVPILGIGSKPSHIYGSGLFITTNCKKYVYRYNKY
nr:hypothetical protein [Clostridioides difficile]